MTNKVNGKFVTRGNDGTNSLPNLVDFAQDNSILTYMEIGSTRNEYVAVVAYQDGDKVSMQMVTKDMYAMMGFSSDKALQAYNNMSKNVRRAIGAYSTHFKKGVGYEN